jgi:hypothetical protein
MGVAPVYLDTMYDAHSQSTSSSIESYRDRKTTGGFVSYSLVALTVVAFVAAPAVMAGVAMGVAGVKLHERVAGLLRRRRGKGGFSPPEVDSGRPA